MVGQAERTCQSDRTWSGTPPTCQRRKCGRLPFVDNGSYVSNATQVEHLFGDELRLQCDVGFVVDGDDYVIRCQAAGVWSQVRARCVQVTCAYPLPPRDGSVKVDAVTFQATANYSCDLGHARQGQSTRVCLESGSWSADEPECKRVQCPELGRSFLNGQILRRGGTGGQSSNEFMTSLTHMCQRGFELVGDVTRTCQANATWSGRPPRCVPVTSPTSSKPR